MKKLLCLALALAMVLSMASFANAAPISNFKTFETGNREMENFAIQATEQANDLNVLVNCIDGLLANDSTGALVPLAAESYSTPDNGLTWNFVLRDGMTWVDKDGNYKADVVAQDWVTAMEWILNFHKNGSANTSMAMDMIAGAADYYSYTKELDEASALALTADGEAFQAVGVKALDKNNLQYTLVDTIPYFTTLTTSACLYPLSQGLVDEIGIDGYKALTWETMWYSGAYTITNYIYQNEKTLTKNPAWWNTEASRFDTVTIKIVESVDTAYQLFQTGELDHTDLSASNLTTISKSTSNEFHDYLVESRPKKYSYQMHFCYDVKTKSGEPYTNWNTAVANVNFRRALYYGMDLTSYLERTNAINPLSCENYCYTANAVAVTSNGVDYTQLVRDRIGLEYDATTFNRYDADKAAAAKAAAISELTAAGVSLPVEMIYFIKGDSTTALQSAQTLQQIISDGLGDDLVKLTIDTYVSSQNTEVRNPQLGCIYINGWGADFGDPVNFMGQETYDDPQAYYSNYYSRINGATDAQLIADYQEFTAMEKAAAAILDNMDARYEAFADAEAYYIDHAFSIPMSYETSWQLTCVNDYSKPYAAYGIFAYWYVNWETNDQIYTSADYAQLKK